MEYERYKHHKDKKKEEEENSLKDLVWKKVRLLDPNDPKGFGIDPCGALIHYDAYRSAPSENDEDEDISTDYRWEIDHTYPKAKLEKYNVATEKVDNIGNLRPMHWKNNRKKSDDYPEYTSVVTRDGNHNVEYETGRAINMEEQGKVQALFGNVKDLFIFWYPASDIPPYFDPEKEEEKD